MRTHRIALFVGWFVVSSLAIAGFAAFRADERSIDAEGGDVPPVVMSAEIGRNAGAVAAMTFALLPDGAKAASPSAFSGDLAALSGDETSASTASEATSTSSSSGVIDRSQFYDESQVRELIEQFFQPEDVNRAIRIAWCESSFNPRSVNPVTGASGLFQHDPATWIERSTATGYPGADILDAEANVAVAAWMLYELPGGWAQWECQA